MNILKELTKNRTPRNPNGRGAKAFKALQRQYSRPVIRQALQEDKDKIAEKRKLPTRNYSQQQRQAAKGVATAAAATPFVQRMGNLLAKGFVKAGPSVAAATVMKAMEPKPAGQGSALYGPGSTKPRKRTR